MPPNPRVAKAFHAMKAIGISEDKVKPALKNLLKLFDKNWELIEEENYRALADAIFEREESEAIEQSKKIVNNEEDYLEEEAQVNEEPERPLKRLRLRNREVAQVNQEPERTFKRLRLRNREVEVLPSLNNTSLPGTSLVIPKEEQVELLETSLQNQNQAQDKADSPQPNTKKLRAESQERSDPSQPSAVNKSQQKTSLRTESNSVSHPMRLRDRGKGTLSPQIPSGEKRSSLAGCHKEPNLQPSIAGLPKQKTTTGHVLVKEEPVTYDVLKLEVPSAVTQPDPSSKGESSSGNGSIRENNGPDLLQFMGEKGTADGVPISNETRNNGNPAMVSDALGAKGTRFHSLNGSVGSQFDEEVALLQEPKLPPSCDGVDDGMQLNKKASENFCVTDEENKENDLEDTNFQHVVVSQERQLTPERISSLHDVVDIAKGQERVVITLVNEFNDKSPPSFFYIPKNAVFQNAYVNFSLARIGDNNCCSTCSGDCLSLSLPCACSHETGGEFAYTSDGLIKEEFLKECISMNRDPEKHCQYFCKECPLERSKNEDIVGSCKGHLVRKFIKECWLKCGCNIQCGNRVVQRGISRNLQVFMTPGGKGWGLRTLEDLPKGAFVCEYVGEVLTNAELYDRVRSSKGEEHSYPVLLDADWCSEVVLKDEDALCLDATYYGNVARFINHRCFDSNMVEIPVEVETPDHHYYHLAFFTTRKVKAMEELTWDYGIDFDDHDHPVKAFRCQCGSRFCRSVKRPSSKYFTYRHDSLSPRLSLNML
ncbi:probable inactive histone-lysine N-methyltransferase SUVR1 [Olea europaea var. sylvestris]|uniref:probable inactive histone-lysine N-methyltransferase SUVR1 n=1 Tax=Olea europaea var. sylvestris TaxID=158386 RepID=UPI000C1D1CE1|nr:probable inactive histone-lysine N-methyltransferase SUVR1 [Olea europaea var. sylvestris]